MSHGAQASNGTPVFPAGKQFAFTILDDTDDSTVENVRPIYRLLADLGLRTTKTAWPLDCPEGSRHFFAAETLQDEHYLRFVHDLVTEGFELAWHCATMESSRRERTVRGLEFFQAEFGCIPKIHCNHGHNRENIYWGAKRYHTSLFRALMRTYARRKGLTVCSGDERESPYFWGDLCQQHFRFVRNFTFPCINPHAIAPVTPYRIASTPFVNHWFSTADAPDVEHFCQVVTRASVDQLHREHGVCILSTHLGKGFVREGKIDPRVEEVLRHLASLPGWFAPAAEVLEHLLEHHPEQTRMPLVRAWKLDWKHALGRVQTHMG